ncbi:ABC-type sugar transport system, permease component [Synechococcus sp. PCC 7502]|uniref:carbohydrate ABC transporter permease n=1 Tax=Synechococcus sp. PCC 7502 TaxID=1173263 RepID=UPI00029F94A2|nr:carbohydrate ABC transporter permease [Synechococcus sp. PCC 7502]AFY72699.1 ABC-type sugar transport system, permease component [Synechococcus sp. PCC 7502]
MVNGNRFGSLILNIGLGLIAIALLFPLIFVIITSFAPATFKPTEGLFPKTWTVANYQRAWQQGEFLLAFFNSTFVAIAVTGCQIFTSALAGYSLARLNFKGRNGVLLIVLATLIIPFQLLVIPIFLVLKWGHLVNTYGALILPTAANGFGIFLIRQYIQTIPIELEEAATLDGANRLQVLWNVILPLTRPALVTLFIFTFIGEWNDLFKALIFTTRPELKTVQLVLSGFQELFTADWSLLMAAVAIATIPVMVLFAIAQRQFIRGVAATGIKN